MEWYWIVIIIVSAIILILFFVGYLFFLHMCKPDREKSRSLDGAEGRALQAYVPKIKAFALQNAKHPHENVSTLSFDGNKLIGKFYPNGRTKEIIILVHGYHSSSSWDFGASFGMYYDAGYSILAVDDRAHGSEGKYIGFGALDHKDVQCWMEWLIKQYGDDCKIAIAGVSMGAASVMLVTGNTGIPQLKCAIEDCGYTSIKDVVADIVKKKGIPLFPLFQFADFWCRILAGYSFRDTNAEKAVKNSQTPTLFIHGTADGFVPFSLLDRVYSACSAEKQKEVFEEAVHGESSYKYPERYKTCVLSFLAKHMS